MAPLRQREEQEDDAPRDELDEKMARLGLHEPVEDSAAVGPFPQAFLRPHRAADRTQSASIVRAAGPAAPSPMPYARHFAEGRLRRGGLVRVHEPGAGTPSAARGVGDHAYMTPPPPPLDGVADNWQLQDPNLFSHVNDQAVLFALSQETPEKTVSYACDLLLSETEHGQQMFYLIFNHCHHQLREWIIAKITRGRSFYSLCVRRTNEVVFMISSCKTRKSMQLFGDAMLPWMSSSQMRVLLSNSKRLQVIHAFIKSSPPDIAKFIFEAVAKECTRLACQSNGLSLLQNCLERVSWMEMDNISIKLSYQSLHLALNSCGNWILQDILRKGDSFHIAIIASCLRNHYVTLAKNKYGSNVVECCLKVFNEEERSVIVNELIYYAHFRDLVTDEFANFTLSTALEVCKYPLRNILANAILSQNIMVRNQHCTRIFSILARYGFIQRTFLRDF